MSVITIVCGGVGAAAQSDLKKTLAYSTISNCGFMMLFGVLNSKSLCFFYFLFHGIFKALSFLLVGAIVLIMGHKQD
jgi:NADH:ubiquinone oxidoreductase subunit 5 (subunit L)/multisubunit Na+/H+ antiporter MnhA subunit